MTFSQWQQRGYDTNGTEISNPNKNVTTRLTGVKAFVRPNAYEAGRVNVVVYNWDRLPSVLVDLSNSGLQNGQSYQIKDVQNILGPAVTSGTYSGGSVSFPMTQTAVSQFIGNYPNQPVHTDQEFGVFIVVPTSTVSSSKAGDLNGDSNVNVLDLSILASHYGQNVSSKSQE